MNQLNQTKTQLSEKSIKVLAWFGKDLLKRQNIKDLAKRIYEINQKHYNGKVKIKSDKSMIILYVNKSNA